jgi:Polysaccharide pyruvyl transferase
VRDRHSAQRLADAGVDTPVEVVPDSALLISRIMPPESLGCRLEKLRAAGGYPRPGVPVLVVQGCELLVPHVDGVAAAVAGWPAGGEVVVVETGRCRGDGVFSAALQRALPAARLWRLPEGAAVEDLAAAIVGGDLFLGSSLHGAITALTYGRPFVLLNLIDDAKLDGFGDLTGLERCVVQSASAIRAAIDSALAEPAPPGLLDGLQRRIDRHFDRVAEIAEEQAAARPEVARDASLDVYAVSDHLGRLRREVDAAGRRAEAAERELTALRATRTFRALAPARRLYGRVRLKLDGR